MCRPYVFAYVMAMINDSFVIFADTMKSHTIQKPHHHHHHHHNHQHQHQYQVLQHCHEKSGIKFPTIPHLDHRHQYQVL